MDAATSTSTSRTAHTAALAAAAVTIAGGLVWASLRWPQTFSMPDIAGALWGADASTPQAPASHAGPLAQLVKLAAAAAIGVLVTAVQRHVRTDKAPNLPMEQAQALLCVAGALMMVIIGNSLARAFGIAGAASIVRFRTPVDDPREAAVLFLLLGLGMAAGLGALDVAGMGAAFLCLFLFSLRAFNEQPAKAMKVELVADREFQTERVQDVFARNHIEIEPLEVAHADQTRVRYRAVFHNGASLDAVSAELLRAEGVRSVAWETPKRQ
jgi:uncharacterized membrane protein YhiD involved in acid resistance